MRHSAPLELNIEMGCAGLRGIPARLQTALAGLSQRTENTVCLLRLRPAKITRLLILVMYLVRKNRTGCSMPKRDGACHERAGIPVQPPLLALSIDLKSKKTMRARW
jgi:hypothetical protein